MSLELGCVGGAVSPSAGVLEHLDWPKTDLSVAKIITVQDYKLTKD